MKTLNQSRRYILVLLIIIAMLIVGPEVKTSENIIPHSIQDNSLVYSEYIMQPSEPEYIFGDLINGLPGDYYRLTMLVRSESTSSDIRQTGLSFQLRTESNLKETIKTVDLQNDTEYMPIEIVFETGDHYRDLFINKTDIYNKSRVVFKNVTITRLNIRTDGEINSLRKTVIGATTYSNATESAVSSQDSRNIYSLAHSGSTVGQIFKANETDLVAVSFKLNFFNGGGNGAYRITLRSATQNSDGGFVVSDQVITDQTFTTETAKDIYVSSKDSMVFEFPLPAKLMKDSYYFVGIDNNDVVGNLAHCLQVYGVSTKKDTDQGVILNSDGTTSLLGNFYNQQFWAHYNTTVDGNKVLTGSISEDLGNGQGRFYYSTTGQFSDYNDLYSLTPEVQFNEGQKRIIAPAKLDEFFIYKIDTTYPWSRLYINATQLSNAKDSIITYSFDQQSWTALTSKNSDNIPDESYAVVNDVSSGHVLYVKIMLDPATENVRYYNNNDHFGLSKLEVSADTVTN